MLCKYAFVSEAGWRLRALLRTQRFYEVDVMVRLYKTHILSYLEGGTPALYHAAPSVLKPLDGLQESFLTELGLTDVEALCDYKLAPLSMRRDISMLGLLFKVASGTAPPPICKLFRSYNCSLASFGFQSCSQFHDKALHDPIEPTHPGIIKRSAFGLIRVFNRLPQQAINVKSTRIFQRRLQYMALQAAKSGKHDWQNMFRAS